MALARSRYESAGWGGRRKNGKDSVHNSESRQVFYLNTLQLEPDALEIAAGGYGSIYRGTIATGSRIPGRLERGRYLPSSILLKNEEPDFKQSGKRVPVAVKKIRKPDNDDEVLELTREGSNIRVLQGVRNVVTAFGVTFCKPLESVCLVMELVDGQQLDAFLRSEKASDSDARWWKTKLEIFMEIVIGLAVCHGNGVYHGDLKGGNILVDKFRVPKLIDFGFSFRKRDIDYLKDVIGGSPFWISPELLESDLQEVMKNPYPSDVYSLGMVLVEIIVDGELPPDLSASFMQNKWFGGSPVTLEVPAGMEDFEPVFAKLFQVVDGCSLADRNERISLQQCLMEVQAAYDQLCRIGKSLDKDFLSDPSGLAAADSYIAMLPTFRAAFPDVPDAVLFQPMENMMVDTKGSSLVELLCKVDYGEGVERILRWNSDRFKLEEEVPRLCRLCVQAGSSKTLKSLHTSWSYIIQQDEWLLHEACEADSAEVLRVLLYDVRMEYNTWHERWPLKPLHKLAYQGKTEMMKIVLDRASSNKRKDYVNDEVAGRTPLYYAVAGDSTDAVFFLLEEGASTVGQGDGLLSSDFLDNLLVTAAENVSLNVMAALSEVSTSLRTTGTMVLCGEKAAQRFQRHFINSIAYLEIEGYRLERLKQHLAEAKRRGLDAFSFGCSRDGDAEVFEMIVSIKDTPRYLWRHLIGYGSREMVAYAMDKLGYDATFDLIHLASKQGNLEVMEFLTELVDRRIRTGRAQKTLNEIYCRPEENSQEMEQVQPEENVNTSGMQKEERVTEVSESEIANVLQNDRVIKEEKVESGDDLEVISEDMPDLKFRSMFDYEFWDVLNQWILDRDMEMERDGILDEFQRISPGSWTETSAKLLIIAAYFGEETTVEKLLQRGVSTDFAAVDDGDSPLYVAIVWEREKVVEMLLKAGAIATPSCMNAALDSGNGSLVRLLIKFGFDTGMKDANNRTYMDLIKTMDANKEKFLEQYKHPFFTATYGEFP